MRGLQTIFSSAVLVLWRDAFVLCRNVESKSLDLSITMRGPLLSTRREPTTSCSTFECFWQHLIVNSLIPIGSMYGIFTYIYHKNQPNVGKCTIHGSSGI